MLTILMGHSTFGPVGLLASWTYEDGTPVGVLEE